MTRALYTAEQTRAIDRDAIERQGIPGLELMARAADAVCRLICEKYPEVDRLVVFAGVGNNAGDGYLVARRMKGLGKSVRIVQLVEGTSLHGDAVPAREEAARFEVPMQPFVKAAPIDEDLVVDALVGTGLSRPLEGTWAQAVEQINQSDAKVVAVDIPSGLDADTGVAGPCVAEADHTVTFIARKRGLYTADGPDYAGRVVYEGLNVESGDPPPMALHDWEEIRGQVARRRRNSHKNDYGHVLVVGGQAGYQGAAELCGAAALRCGGGLASLAQPPEALGGRSPMPELMCHAVADRRAFRELAGRASVIAAGPGLGQDAWAQDVLGEILEMSVPRVIDADALRLLAADPRKNPSDDWVLTPHPGEAAALLGITAAEVQADRFAAVGRIQDTYGGTVVLKGCGTLVAQADGNIGVCSGGNPGMATAGMGDVLTGVIASLIGQGMDIGQAALAGACLHAGGGRPGERTGNTRPDGQRPAASHPTAVGSAGCCLTSRHRIRPRRMPPRWPGRSTRRACSPFAARSARARRPGSGHSLRVLGHDGVVPSPTYTLVEPYEVDGLKIWHVDLYRLQDPLELEALGVRELLDGDAVMLVEWPERWPEIEAQVGCAPGLPAWRCGVGAANRGGGSE